ncbi:MAG: ribosome recycling factor [Leptospiraceae bacterium]|nr:ribosome recycling factor [Leptospiraceae bacterium]MCB1199031.1 ribosome recycling factor [Leptospiraceae bacterium]
MEPNENIELILEDAKERMGKSFDGMHTSLLQVRSGRATPSLVEDIRIEAYGDVMPLNQLANISIPEARLILVDPFDKSQIQNIEKGIQKSGRNLNPQSDGSIIRIPLPDMSEETRREMVKLARTKVEDSKIAIRNIRRDANEDLKKLKSEGVSEDAIREGTDEVQKLTDSFIKKMDDSMAAKEKEIMSV